MDARTARMFAEEYKKSGDMMVRSGSSMVDRWSAMWDHADVYKAVAKRLEAEPPQAMEYGVPE